MDTAFTICIVIGFTIPLLTLIFGGLLDGITDGEFDGFDLDWDFDLDFGSFCISLLPFSLHSICAGLLLFGVMGKVLLGSLNGWIVIAIGVVVGYCGAVVIQSLVRTLRRIEHTTYSQEDLIAFDGKVINTIVVGGFGSVSVTTLDGVTRSFPARAENPTQLIKQGSVVTIITFEKNTAIVKPKDIGEKYQLKN